MAAASAWSTATETEQAAGFPTVFRTITKGPCKSFAWYLENVIEFPKVELPGWAERARFFFAARLLCSVKSLSGVAGQ